MDLTLAEIAAAIPAADPLKAWWESAQALPGDTTTSEFFAKTLKAANDAQRAKNVNLAAGARLDLPVRGDEADLTVVLQLFEQRPIGAQRTRADAGEVTEVAPAERADLFIALAP